MFMNRFCRIPLVVVFSGALLLPFGMRAQDKEKQDTTPADAQQDSGRKGDKPQNKAKNLKKLQKELDTPYKKWLQEEVPYIISDEERAAFLQLQTNEEREQFIEQFWQRRDPTPGTVENEFKEEHYRRIAYSNENYSDPDLAGWKTDRGMIYIRFGPPDEKESHPSAVPPYERWLYRYIEGIGQNVIIEFAEDRGKM